MKFLSIFILIFSPLIAGILLYTRPFKHNPVLIRRFAKGFESFHFLYALGFLAMFNPVYEGISYYKELKVFNTSWIAPLGLKFSFGMDGLSVILVVLTTFIMLMALIVSKNCIKVKPKFYYSMMFLLETAMLGVFCARDMFLFFMFWELELIPMYFLIGQWGDKNAKASAMKFVLYTFGGSLFMLLGILLLHFYNYATYGFMTSDFSNLIVNAPHFPMQMQLIISILLLVGFAVKLPIVPFHTWLPNAHTEAPAPVSMILAGVLLKMGAYGIIRFNMGILPEAFKIIAPVLMIFAIINIIYAGFIAYTQTDIKKIIAYSSISSMGIVLLGLCSLNIIGFSGAIYQMIAHGIISAGLFMLTGAIYLRTKTREMLQLGGLGHVMPRLTGFAIIFTLASVGLPLLVGFIGEFLVFVGTFNSALSCPVKLYAILSISVLFISVCYMLRFLHKTFFGNILERWNSIKDITNHEFFVLSIISITIIVFGIFPMSILNIVQPVLIDILQYLQI